MLHLETIEPDTLGLLKRLMARPYLAGFNLVGGTALSLQLGHRVSVDLDLFTAQAFESAVLLEQLQKDFSSVEPTHAMGSTLLCRIEVIKVDFVRFRYPFQYPLIEQENLRLVSSADIASMKLDAIAAKGRRKDFYDLYFLLEDFTLPQILETYSAMFQHSTLFHVIRSLTYFEDAEADATPLIFDKTVTWDKVKKRVAAEVRKL